MTWFRVDDGFSDHPKVLAAKASKHWKGAIALWTLAGSWSSKHEKDGFVPEHVVPHLGASKQEAEVLVSAELWERVEGGYQFHDWTKCNPLRAELEGKREQGRNRVDKWRKERATQKQGNAAGNALHTQPVTLVVTPPPTRPGPTRPVPTVRESAHAELESFVRREFARRFEEAEGSLWTRAGDAGVATLAAWLRSLPGEPEANLARTLGNFFADDWARSQHFPIAHLARDVHKYFDPRAFQPAAKAKASAEERLADLRAEYSQLETSLAEARCSGSEDDVISAESELAAVRAEMRDVKAGAA